MTRNPTLWPRDRISGILWLFIPLLFIARVRAVPRPANFARPVSLFVQPLPTTTLPVTTEFTSTVPTLQTTSTDVSVATEGVINISLQPTGHATLQPFPQPSDVVPITSIETAAGVPTGLLTTATLQPTTGTKANILNVPIATGPPPSLFQTRSDHPVVPVNISGRQGPLQTNKFYGNLLVGDQRQPIWPQPYSLWWAKDGSIDRMGLPNSFGLAVSNIDRDDLVYGDSVQPGDPPKFFSAPLYVQQIILSATELGANTHLTTDSHKQFSVNLNLLPAAGAEPLIRFPIVQGMGFVSGLYTDATPLLQSNVLFTELVDAGAVNEDATFKYRIKLKDESKWLLSVTPNGALGRPPFMLMDSNTISGPGGFTGLIQIAKNIDSECAEFAHDEAAGAYPISATISASVEGAIGTYSFSWLRGGSETQKLLIYALPHHQKSMAPDTIHNGTCAFLWTSSKGLARGIHRNTWTLQENDLPVNIDFDPWRPDLGTIRKVASEAADLISDSAAYELAQDIDKLTNLDSAYYGGKIMSKFAYIVYTVNKLGQNPSLRAIGLRKLEEAFARWIENRQTWPFTYDPVWGGIVSTASYEGRDSGFDFGGTYYNDHHFHYGYFVHAASIIAYLHPDWLQMGNNKVWVDTLIRDYANSDVDDPYFPPSRAFDYFSGHSWATGIFSSSDGKNEESTSEDAFAAYAMKMWGHVTGDPNMEARGNVQLAIMKNSFANYFYYSLDNAVQPPAFARNIVSGILFENKIDHSTFFGQSPEFVHGIHMLPISPITSYIRPNTFVAHEWATYFQSQIPLGVSPDTATGVIRSTDAYGGLNCSERTGMGRLINCVSPEWKSLLMGNLAQVDSKLAWDYFANVGGDMHGGDGFDWQSLAGSGSRTWYLAYTAAFGGLVRR